MREQKELPTTSTGTSQTYLASDACHLMRRTNCPELVFNQLWEQDESARDRWFEQGQEHRWRISEGCPTCLKHQYTLLFYERSTGSGGADHTNKQLHEITDINFLQQIKEEYEKLHSYDPKVPSRKVNTPLIFGTVVRNATSPSTKLGADLDTNHSISNRTFSRKLRMMRADLFALLMISDRKDFFDDPEETKIIQNNVVHFLRGEYNERVKTINVFKQLKGWNRVLNQKCYQNHVHPVTKVNTPECIRDSYSPPVTEGSDHYVFGAYLEPNWHQFIIYDPLINRAFCQEFVVEMEPVGEWIGCGAD